MMPKPTVDELMHLGSQWADLHAQLRGSGHYAPAKAAREQLRKALTELLEPESAPRPWLTPLISALTAAAVSLGCYWLLV